MRQHGNTALLAHGTNRIDRRRVDDIVVGGAVSFKMSQIKLPILGVFVIFFRERLHNVLFVDAEARGGGGKAGEAALPSFAFLDVPSTRHEKNKRRALPYAARRISSGASPVRFARSRLRASAVNVIIAGSHSSPRMGSGAM